MLNQAELISFPQSDDFLCSSRVNRQRHDGWWYTTLTSIALCNSRGTQAQSLIKPLFFLFESSSIKTSRKSLEPCSVFKHCWASSTADLRQLSLFNITLETFSSCTLKGCTKLWLNTYCPALRHLIQPVPSLRSVALAWHHCAYRRKMSPDLNKNHSCHQS